MEAISESRNQEMKMLADCTERTRTTSWRQPGTGQVQETTQHLQQSASCQSAQELVKNSGVNEEPSQEKGQTPLPAARVLVLQPGQNQETLFRFVKQ